MARAKQTNRAEARRRYRQTVGSPESEDGAASTGELDAPPPAAARKASAAPNSRPSLLASFRLAYHRPQYAEDLRLLPRLLRGQWFLIAAGLTLAGFVAEVLFPNYDGSNLAFTMLTVPPAMVPIFLVGFTAPRASYLLGLVLGIFDLVLYLVFIAWIYAPAPDTALPIGSLLFNGLVTGLPAAVLFAAAAAFYRRFLALTSPPGRGGSNARRGKTNARAAKPASRRS